LWLASLLVRECGVGARDGRDLADEHVDSVTAPYLFNVNCCYFAFLSFHASCWSSCRRIRSKEAALFLFNESLVGDCGRRPGDATRLGFANPYLILGSVFLLGVGFAVNAPAWMAFIPESSPKKDPLYAITLRGPSVQYFPA
jgi:Transmembrane secretion effector